MRCTPGVPLQGPEGTQRVPPPLWCTHGMPLRSTPGELLQGKKWAQTVPSLRKKEKEGPLGGALMGSPLALTGCMEQPLGSGRELNLRGREGERSLGEREEFRSCSRRRRPCMRGPAGARWWTERGG